MPEPSVHEYRLCALRLVLGTLREDELVYEEAVRALGPEADFKTLCGVLVGHSVSVLRDVHRTNRAAADEVEQELIRAMRFGSEAD